MDAVGYSYGYSDGVNSDYRLITKAEALAILTNNALLAKLGLTGLENFWTIEELDVESAYYFDGIQKYVHLDDKVVGFFVLPVRKVNFYGLPLIESEFGGGLVYDVVAATRTVDIVAKWQTVIDEGVDSHYNWLTAIDNASNVLIGGLFSSLPTRAQALKIFGNSYLVTLAGLPVDNSYWTSEDVGNGDAWYFIPNDLIASITTVSSQYYALPVRSEVVPET